MTLYRFYHPRTRGLEFEVEALSFAEAQYKLLQARGWNYMREPFYAVKWKTKGFPKWKYRFGLLSIIVGGFMVLAGLAFLAAHL